MTALIVDDNAAVRTTFRELLCSNFPDLMVLQAASTREALAALTTQQFDIVLVDLHLGKDSGLDLIDVVKAGDSKTAVVLMTTDDDPEYRVAAERHGADGFLSKNSASTHEIVELLGSLLTKSRSAAASVLPKILPL